MAGSKGKCRKAVGDKGRDNFGSNYKNLQIWGLKFRLSFTDKEKVLAVGSKEFSISFQRMSYKYEMTVKSQFLEIMDVFLY